MKRLRLPVFPPIACEPNCGECCTIVPVTENEYARVERFVRARGITPRQQGITCPLFLDGACAVYPVRPIICRAFGHSAKLACPRGHNVDVPESVIHREVRRVGAPTRMLHELAGMTYDDVRAAIDAAASV